VVGTHRANYTKRTAIQVPEVEACRQIELLHMPHRAAAALIKRERIRYIIVRHALRLTPAPQCTRVAAREIMGTIAQ
jgi:hypothetical protein